MEIIKNMGGVVDLLVNRKVIAGVTVISKAIKELKCKYKPGSTSG